MRLENSDTMFLSTHYPIPVYPYFAIRVAIFLNAPGIAMRAILTLEQEVPVETAIGVFAARERAEEAIKSLVENHVPEEAIVYLTRSESEAQSIGKQLGSYAGGFVGGAAGFTMAVNLGAVSEGACCAGAIRTMLGTGRVLFRRGGCGRSGCRMV